MEENEYKSTYDDLTSIRCVFEKSLTNHYANCGLANHFCLADREGYACTNEASAARCNQTLSRVRDKAAFALKLKSAHAQLPHNKEIQVQVGGLIGISRLISDVQHEKGAKGENIKIDINTTFSAATTQFGSTNALPYAEIIRSVVSFKGRRRSKKK